MLYAHGMDETQKPVVVLGGRSWAPVDPGDRIKVVMPLKTALLSAPGAAATVERIATVTKGGNVRMEDGTILPLPCTYRLRRER